MATEKSFWGIAGPLRHCGARGSLPPLPPPFSTALLTAGSVMNNGVMLVTFLWRVWLSINQAMVFTKEDGILIKVLRQSKGYSARKLLNEFPDKDWSCPALDWLLRQIDDTGSADRKSGSSRERTVCTRNMQMSVQMATTLSTNCNWWYCVRTAKATFPY